jgi:hypothetical protein
MPLPLYCKIHLVSYIIPTTVGIVRFSSLGRAMRVLTILSILTCIDVAAQYVVALWLGSNLFISHFYVVVEFLMLCAVFYWSVPLKRTKNTILMVGGAFIVFWAVDLVFFFNPHEINTVTQMVERILLIVISTITLQGVVRDERSSLFQRPVFWAANSVILYSAGTLVAVGLGNQLMALGMDYFLFAWNINWTLIIIANLLYAKGMLCKSEP